MTFKFKKGLFLIFFLLFQFITVSLQQNPNFSLFPHPSEGYSNNKNLADYTLLIYMIGSDLESKSYSATNDLVEMKNAVHNSKLNVIVETGGGGGTINTPSSGKRFVDFSRVERHEILNGTTHTLMDLGQRNMGDPNTLSDFIKWGLLQFPAKKYAIILWDHGSGLNGFGKDLIFNNDILTPIELKQAFLNAKVGTNITFELIGFDACLMSSLEVASKLQNVAHYMVSSEEVEPSWGWNYTAIIQNLTANSEQSGRYLGMAIVDSFARHSRNFSISEKFGADKAITLALIDMTKIPQLVKDVNALSDTLGSNIADLHSAISLSRATDLTERYGQSAQGSIGLVDLSDLLLNIQEKYPSLAEKIKAVQNSLETASIYKFNGEARPHANGLSVYMPLLNEFSNTTELFALDVDWFRLLMLQKSIITNDKQPPIIKSIREGSIVTANAYGSDFARIYAQIVTNSSKGHDFIYIQSIEPSLIDNHGFFQYKQHKMLVICNETKCIPTTMKLEVNRDKKFAFIPVRLESKQDNISKDVSLVYEIGQDGKLVFLGATPEIDPDKTIPKGRFSLKSNDLIFIKALSSKAEYTSTGEISGQKLGDISRYVEAESLLVNNPQKIEPRYINFSSPFTISFIICDYSDNCDKTRWYNFNSGKENLAVLSPELEFGYDILSKDVLSRKDARIYSELGSNFSTYINPTFGFKLQYPSDWIEKRQNIYDNSTISDDTIVDNMVVSFSSSKYINSGNFPTSLSISVTDWPFKQGPKSVFDFFNKTHNQNKLSADNVDIIYSNATVIAGNPAFKFMFKYISKPEQSLGTVKEQRMEQIITVLMDKRMYIIDYGSYSSQFYRYLPLVEEIVNSFGPYKNQNNNTISTAYDYINRLSNSSRYQHDTNNTKTEKNEVNLEQNIINNNKVFSNYTHPIYGYKIQYPLFNGDLGKPFALENTNPNLRGEVFTLDDPAVRSADTSNSVNLVITPFHKNETQQMKNASPTILNPSGLQTFDINGIISNVNNQLSFLKSNFINFTLLDKGTPIIFKNHSAYTIEYKLFNPVYRSSMQEKVIYVILDDYLFIFEYQAKPSNYYHYLPIFQKMANSFEFERNIQSKIPTT